MKKLTITLLLGLSLLTVGCKSKQEPIEKMCVNCGKYFKIDELKFDGLDYYCNCYGRTEGYCNDCGKVIPLDEDFRSYKDLYCKDCYNAR